MLTFNEGVPGAGKTYDSIKEHLLPALKAGRTVYARINGLDHQAIADYLGVELRKVREQLLPVSSEQVREFFRAERDEAGEFVISEKFRNSLVLIDEAHEFYVSSRDALPKEEEQFFAIHRHYGLDIVLMTQWYKRLHTALRARIERKNVFQKLTAVSMKNRYLVTFWHTVAPDKYEKVGTATRKYDPAVFPLYKGVAGDEVQTEVYEGGSRSVWASVLPLFVIGGIFAAVGIAGLLWFFNPKGSAMLSDKKQPPSAPTAAAQPVRIAQVDPAPMPPAAREPGGPVPKQVEKQPDVTEGMTPEQAYVWNLSKRARVRVAIKVGEGADARGVIEFREQNQPPTEALDVRQLRAMGITVEGRPYGFLLTAHGESIVATAWPTNEVTRDRKEELYCLDCGPGGTAPAMRASEASATPAGSSSAGVIAAAPSSVTAYGANARGEGTRANVGEFKMRE